MNPTAKLRYDEGLHMDWFNFIGLIIVVPAKETSSTSVSTRNLNHKACFATFYENVI